MRVPLIRGSLSGIARGTAPSVSACRALAVVLSAGTASAQTGLHPKTLPAEMIASGIDLRDFAIADLDGDGDADIVAVDVADPVGGNRDEWFVLLNDGTGRFSVAVHDLFTRKPRGVALGDLDGDGDPDAVLSALANDPVVVLFNNGDGTFGAETAYPGGTTALRPLLLDLEGDGDLDAVIGFSGTDDLRVYRNAGDGTFDSGTIIDDTDLVSGTATGDADGDGDPDLAVARDRSSSVQLFLNEAGTLVPGPVFPTSSTAYGVSFADSNGDGHPDLTVSVSGGFDTLLGDGQGGFAPGAPPAGVPADGPTPAFTDANGDGDPDLLFVTLQDELVVSLNDGAWTFSEAWRYAAGERPGVAKIADLTGNGVRDLVFIAVQGDGLCLLRGNAGARFETHETLDAGSSAERIATGDFNGDGMPDAVVANRTGDDVSVRLNQGGSFGAQLRFGVGDDPRAVATGDLDGDGLDDIVTTAAGGPDLSVLYASETTVFEPAIGLPIGGVMLDVALGDLDNDGDLDIVASADTDIAVRLNEGDRSFAEPVSVATAQPRHIALGDVNRDGTLDIVAAVDLLGFGVYDAAAVLLGAGDGTFAGPAYYTTATGPPSSATLAVALGDADGDGDLDIAAANSYASGVTPAALLRNNGDGTFAPLEPIETGRHATDAVFTDIDLDGDLDLAIANEADRIVSVHVNPGNGAFGARRRFLVGDGPFTLVVSDIDADGDDDLLTAKGFDHGIGVLRNGFEGDPPCGVADLADPRGMLDLADIVAFISALTTQGPAADLAEPFGVWDLADIVEFAAAFSGGCP
jgi:hypothetical protein